MPDCADNPLLGADGKLLKDNPTLVQVNGRITGLLLSVRLYPCLGKGKGNGKEGLPISLYVYHYILMLLTLTLPG